MEWDLASVRRVHRLAEVGGSVRRVGLLDRIRSGEYVSDEPAVAASGRTVTISLAADRIVRGEPTLHAIRDFLDGAGRAEAEMLMQLVEQEPRPTGEARADALLGAVAEYLAVRHGFPCPRWAQAPERFLDRFWFVSDVRGFRAVAIAQTPVSLKRRGIFWPERSLQRV